MERASRVAESTEEALSRALDQAGERAIVLRRGASWPRQVLMLACLVGVTAVLLETMTSVRLWAFQRVEILFVIGGMAS
jgi:hypothetical protein